MVAAHSKSAFPPADPILAARLEAVQLLADRVAERVLVIAPDLTIIYANEAAWPAYRRSDTLRPAKCFEAFQQRSDPCDACVAKELFTSGSVRSIACQTGGDGSACGMHQAFPLMCGRGEGEAVLVLLAGPAGGMPASRTTVVTASNANPRAGRCLGPLIGQSAAMQALFEMMHLVADSQATVLVQGESGTGKELVARTIHALSPRSNRPFMVVDCGSLSETLLESELFGHVKGAFTGAVTAKKGLLEEADGGTLFLDEIADTTPQFQAKLLRVVQEGEIRPVGSARAITVDVRIISATNKDLLPLILAKTFRADLYYRLAVLPLVLPPLRDRRDDIPLLVDHFMALSCRRHRRSVKRLTDQTLQRLVEAPWAGNVRELQHVIERVVVTAQADLLDETDLFGAPAHRETHSDLPSLAKRAVSGAERAGILEALRQADGNKARAARLLKISRASLYNKLRLYSISGS